MLERLHFLVMYVGSAAIVAFLAAVLSSPRVAVYSCDVSDARGVEPCEVVVTLSSTFIESSTANFAGARGAESDQPSPVSLALAATP